MIFALFENVITFAVETSGKTKFWFMQEPWMYFLVNSRNSQIFYVINIMTLSKFAQKICFYLLVASLYLIRSKLKISTHSFIHFIPAPKPWWMISSRALLKKILRKVAFLNLIIFFGDSYPMLKSCWVHSKNNNFLSYCSDWWNEGIQMEWGIQNYKIQNQPFAGLLQGRWF